MSNKLFSVVGIIGFAATVPTARAAEPIDPWPLLERSWQHPQIPYQGRFMVTQWYGRQSRSEESLVWYDPQLGKRQEVLTPQGESARVILYGPETEQVYLPDRRLLLSGNGPRAEASRSEEEHRLLRLNYRAVHRGAGQTAGRATWKLELLPLQPGKPHLHLSLDEETGVVLESRRYAPGGHLAWMSRFSEFRPGLKADSDRFQLVTASGTTVDSHGLDPDFYSFEELRKATGRRPALPESLPAGFHFQSADYFTLSGDTVRSARYSDGVSVLSVFETRRKVRMPREADLRLSAAPGWASAEGSVYTWTGGGRHYTLVTDVRDQPLRLILSHLKQSTHAGL